MKPYEAKKIVFLHLRIDKKTDDLIKEASDNIGLDKTALSRMLLISSLRKLKSDALKVGWENLEYTIKHD